MSGKKLQRFLAYFRQPKRLTIILLVFVLLCSGSIAVSILFSALWPWFYNLLSIPPNPIVTNNLTFLIGVISLILAFIANLLAFIGVLIAALAWQKPKSPESPPSTPASPTTQTPPIIPTPPASSPSPSPVPQLGTTISTPIPSTTNIISASASNPTVAQTAPVQTALPLSATPLPTNPAPNGMIAPPVTEQPPTLPTTPISIFLEGQTDHKLVFWPITALTDKEAFYGRTFELERIKRGIANKESIPIRGISLAGKTWLITYLKLIALTEPDSGNNYIISVVDANLPSCKTVAGFTTQVLEGWGKTDLITDDHSLGLIEVEKAIKHFTRTQPTPITPVLCIDHFEGLTESNFDLDFFKNLRTFANNHKLVLIVLSRKALKNYDNGKADNFYKVFGSAIRIKAFTPEEAERFIQIKCDEAHFTSAKHATMQQYIQNPKNRYPYLIQRKGIELSTTPS